MDWKGFSPVRRVAKVFLSVPFRTRGNLSIVALYVCIRFPYCPSIPHALRSSRRQRATFRVAIRNVRGRRCDSMKSKYMRVRRKKVWARVRRNIRKNILEIQQRKWRNFAKELCLINK